MKALADPRSAEGRQEIQAIKASICVLHEALAKSNSRRSGHSELVAQHAAKVEMLGALGWNTEIIQGVPRFTPTSQNEALLNENLRVRSALDPNKTVPLRQLTHPVKLAGLSSSTACMALVKGKGGSPGWYLCAGRVDCHHHGEKFQQLHGDRMLEFTEPYGLMDQGLGCEFVHQIPADVMRIWCESRGITIDGLMHPLVENMAFGVPTQAECR